MSLRKRAERGLRGGVVAVAVLGAGLAWGERISVDLPLTPPGTVNRMSVGLTATLALGGTRSDSDVASITGNLLADLEMTFDPGGHGLSGIEGLELTGGQFQVSNVSFNLDWGWLLGKIDLAGTGLGGTFDTPSPPGAVSGDSFSAADHEAIIRQGTFKASGSGAVGNFLPENPYTIDLSASPMHASGGGSGKIEVSAPSIAGGVARYSIKVTLPVNMDEIIYDDAMYAQVRFTGQGMFEAAGQFERSLPPAVATWNVNGDGSWSAAANWSPSAIPDAAGATAQFLGKLTGPGATITLDGDRTVGRLLFDNANAYTIASGTGGALTLDGGGAGVLITAARGAHVISAPINLNDSAVMATHGSAMLELAGGLSGSPGIGLNKQGEGKLVVHGGLWLDPQGDLSVDSGQLIADRITARVLTIGADAGAALDGAPALRALVAGLEIAGGADAWLGTLDVGSAGMLIVASAQAAAPDLEQILNQVRWGRDGGVEGPWSGKGITSSAARADPRHLTSVGVRPDALGILIRYVYNGDANLDGVVNADDYFQIDSGFIAQGQGWHNGDFNYDGVVNADDYFLIDSAFIGQGGPRGGSLSAGAVPEPACLLPVLFLSFLSAFGRAWLPGGRGGHILPCRGRRAGAHPSRGRACPRQHPRAKSSPSACAIRCSR